MIGGIRVPDVGDKVKLLVDTTTVVGDAEEEVPVPAGTVCEVVHIEHLTNGRGVQFEILPLRPDGGPLGASLFVDRADEVDGVYPIEPVEG